MLLPILPHHVVRTLTIAELGEIVLNYAKTVLCSRGLKSLSFVFHASLRYTLDLECHSLANTYVVIVLCEAITVYACLNYTNNLIGYDVLDVFFRNNYVYPQLVWSKGFSIIMPFPLNWKLPYHRRIYMMCLLKEFIHLSQNMSKRIYSEN